VHTSGSQYGIEVISSTTDSILGHRRARAEALSATFALLRGSRVARVVLAALAWLRDHRETVA
jgi:hypothetical protein